MKDADLKENPSLTPDTVQHPETSEASETPEAPAPQAPEIDTIQTQVREGTADPNTTPLLEARLRDPYFLPTREQILTALPTYRDYNDFFGDVNAREKTPTSPIHFDFEILNDDHLEALALYISERVKEYGATAENPLTILELGAGNGRLAHFLREKLEKIAPGQIKLIATDSGSWRIEPIFPVEKLGHQEALQKYKPQIAIFSWIPSGKDPTKDIRKTPEVKEYILIGDPELCGEDWDTYGNNTQGQFPREEGKIPPYEEDGFSSTDLSNISGLQMSIGDNRGSHFHSKTISFKRTSTTPPLHPSLSTGLEL